MSFFFPPKNFFNSSCKEDLLAVNSLNFCTCEKFLYPSVLKLNFTEYRILGWWGFFSPSQLFKHFVPISSCLLGFLKVKYNSYLHCSIGKVFFPFRFWNFSLTLFFCSFYLSVVFLGIYSA